MAKNSESDKDRKIKELQRQRDFYKSILDAIPMGVFLKDRQSRYVYSNKMCNECNHVGEGELYGKTDYDLWPSSELAKNYIESDRAVLERRESYHSAVPIVQGDRLFYQELFKEPYFDKKGRVQGIAGFVVDTIGHRGPVYEQYGGTTDSLIFDYIFERECVIILKPHKDFPIFQKQNLTVEEIFTSDFLFSDTKTLLEDAVKHFFNGETPIHTIVKLFDREKRLRFCSLQMSCFYDEEKKPYRISGILTVIDDEKIRERQLEMDVENARKQIFDLVCDNVDLCLYVNPQTDYCSVLHSTEDAEELSKSNSWNVFMKSVYDHVEPEDYGTVKNLFLSLNYLGRDEFKRLNRREFRILHKNGNYRWKTFKVNKVKNGDDDSFVLSFIDVNELS